MKINNILKSILLQEIKIIWNHLNIKANYKKFRKYNNEHFNYDKIDIVKLFDSCEDGYIPIFIFHSGAMINRILINREYLYIPGISIIY